MPMKQDASHHVQDPLTPMCPETEKRLQMLLYRPRYCSDPEAVLRFAREVLGRPDLRHATIMTIGEAAAARLIPELERVFPDRTARIAARVVEEFDYKKRKGERKR